MFSVYRLVRLGQAGFAARMLELGEAALTAARNKTRADCLVEETVLLAVVDAALGRLRGTVENTKNGAGDGEAGGALEGEDEEGRDPEEEEGRLRRGIRAVATHTLV